MRYLISAGLLFILFGFQNCGPGFVDSKSTTDPLSQFRLVFDYPYNQKPDYYVQIQLVSRVASARFSDVAVLAIIGQAEGTVKNFTYELSLTNENGFPVCPTLNGQLVSGETSIEGACTTNTNSKSVKVVLKITVDGQQKVFEKIY